MKTEFRLDLREEAFNSRTEECGVCFCGECGVTITNPEACWPEVIVNPEDPVDYTPFDILCGTCSEFGNPQTRVDEDGRVVVDFEV